MATIATWWEKMGRHKYPNARRLLITADGGGSNGHRPWLWKHELAKLAKASAQVSALKVKRPHRPISKVARSRIAASVGGVARASCFVQHNQLRNGKIRMLAAQVLQRHG